MDDKYQNLKLDLSHTETHLFTFNSYQWNNFKLSENM